MGQPNAQTTGGALAVVNLEDLAAEPGGTTRAHVGIVGVRFGCRRCFLDGAFEEVGAQGLAGVGEVAGDDRLPQVQPVAGSDEPVGDGGRDFGEDGAGVGLSRGGRGFKWGRALGILPKRLPPFFLSQVEEGILRGALIVPLPDEFEIQRESCPQVLAPRDALRRGPALSDKIHHGEQQERLVRTLMSLTPGTNDTDIEVIQCLDGFADVFPWRSRHECIVHATVPKARSQLT